MAAFSILRIGKTEKLPMEFQTVNIELEEFQAHDEEEIGELPITISLCHSAVNEYASGNCPQSICGILSDGDVKPSVPGLG